MGQSQVTELQIFSGGLRIQAAEHLIKQEEARYLANANIRFRNLTPFLAPLFVEPATDHFMYNFQTEFEYFPTWRSNVLYNNVWYYTHSLGSGKKYADGTELPLGIAPPIARADISAQAPTDGEGLTGNINYVYTYYDPVSGSESPPSPPSITLDLTGVNADQAIIVENYLPSPDGFETRLYRIGGVITAYTLVITIDDTVLSYVDQLSFTEIEGIILDTFRAYPAPTGLNYLTEHQGRFYGAVNSKLMFTPLGKPDSWYALDFIGFPEVIKGLASTANGLLVMTDDQTFVITGNNPQQFTKHLLSSSEGCRSARSIATNEGTAIWLSSSGFVMSNGGQLKNLSIDILGRFKGMEPNGAAFLDKRYFMSFTAELVPSDTLFPSEVLYPATATDEGAFALPSGAAVIDFSFGSPAFSTLIDEELGDLEVYNSELYQISTRPSETKNLVTEDGLNNFITENGLFNIVGIGANDISLTKTLAGEDFRILNYLSPMLTEGSIGTYKQYEKVRFVYRGDFTVIITNDKGDVLQTTDLSSPLVRANDWVNIPVEHNTGYGIQFRIVGKCVIDSIMYNWTPKEAQ